MHEDKKRTIKRTLMTNEPTHSDFCCVNLISSNPTSGELDGWSLNDHFYFLPSLVFSFEQVLLLNNFGFNDFLSALMVGIK